MNNQLKYIEICVESVVSGINAVNSGANRLEVNQALSLGGLTPSVSMIKLLKENIKIPLIAMIRPRHGYFTYSELEYKTMKYSAEALLDSGADGIAFGFIAENGKIDTKRVKEFARLAEAYETVFHRAFDVLQNQLEGMETLIDLGITRILTSGGKQNAIQGKDTIKKLVELSRDRIEILPAGGIRPDNAKEFIAYTKVNQIHSSCMKKVMHKNAHDLSFVDTGINDNIHISIDEDMVKTLSSLRKAVEG